MGYQAILWDLDGTLLNTLDDLAGAVNAALRIHGLPPRTREEVRCFVGNGVRMLLRLAVPEGFPDCNIDAVLSDFRTHYAAHCNDATAPYPGVMEALTRLRDQGIPMAVVSNKPDPAVKALCKIHFGGLIPLAIGECEGVRRKPAPDSVQKALTLLGVEAADAVYIGDSEVDIATAQNAGLPSISVSWGFRPEASLRKAGAKHIAPDIAALMELLDRRNTT